MRPTPITRQFVSSQVALNSDFKHLIFQNTIYQTDIFFYPLNYDQYQGYHKYVTFGLVQPLKCGKLVLPIVKENRCMLYINETFA